MAEAPEVLTVKTAVARRVVVIDGVRLEMLNQDEIKLDAGVRLNLILDAFRDKQQLTEEGAMSLSNRLIKAVHDVLPAMPQELDGKLSDENRINIVAAFFTATEAPAPRLAEAYHPAASC